MRFLAILPIIAMLAACQADTTDIDASVKQSLPQACAAASTGYTTIVGLHAAGVVSDKTMAKVDAVWLPLQPVCADPANATAAGVLVQVLAAGVVIATTLKGKQKDIT